VYQVGGANIMQTMGVVSPTEQSQARLRSQPAVLVFFFCQYNNIIGISVISKVKKSEGSHGRPDRCASYATDLTTTWQSIIIDHLLYNNRYTKIYILLLTMHCTFCSYFKWSMTVMIWNGLKCSDREPSQLTGSCIGSSSKLHL
jgi:hypothetical protein